MPSFDPTWSLKAKVQEVPPFLHGSRFRNFVANFCKKEQTLEELCQMHPKYFRSMQRERIAKAIGQPLRAVNQKESHELVRNLFQFMKYKQLDLRKEFHGPSGQKKHEIFINNILLLASEAEYNISIKELELLVSFESKNSISTDELAKQDPLFAINLLYASKLEQHLKGEEIAISAQENISPSPIRNIVISGGGAKGAVLPNAFRTLMKRSPGILYGTEKVLGSSVGAITSALIASGISRDTLLQIGGVDMRRLLGYSPVAKNGIHLTRFIRQCIRINILQRLAEMPMEKRKVFMDSPEGRSLQKQLFIPVELSRISFKMLSDLRKLDPKHFKDLFVTATTKNGDLQVFSAEKTPEYDIALACRASAGIPLFFQPVEGVINDEEKRLFDGGMVDNVPVSILEEKKSDVDLSKTTLIMAFESRISEGGLSIFDRENQKDPYKPTLMSRLFRDTIIPKAAGMNMLVPNTVSKAVVLQHIKEFYEYIVSFDPSVGLTDFGEISENPEVYAQIGKNRMKMFLKRHPLIQ